MGRRYLWLDGLRGIAAIAVMCYHYDSYLDKGTFFDASFLAVDLFFILSGFVLSHAYGAKLQSGMTFGKFVLVRLVRLYPTYLFASLVGFAYYLAKIAMGTPDAPPLPDALSALALNLVFLPFTGHAPELTGGIFPFSPSAWSLSAEMFVSLAYGFLIWKLPMAARLALVVVTAIVFAYCSWHYDTVDLGWSQSTFVWGLFRALCEFVLGAVLYDVASKREVRANWLAPVLIGLATLALVFVPPTELAAFVLIAGLFPVIMVSQPSQDPTGLLGMIAHELGRISYPVYLLHTAVLLWVAGAYKEVFGSDPYYAGTGFGIVMLASTILLSWLFVKFVDEPLRRVLNRAIHRRSALDTASVG